MLSSVLRSERAIQINVAIMRAFVSLRRLLATNDTLSHKMAELERRLEGHDKSIRSLFDAIRELMTPPTKPRREIGFHSIGKEATTDEGIKLMRSRSQTASLKRGENIKYLPYAVTEHGGMAIEFR